MTRPQFIVYESVKASLIFLFPIQLSHISIEFLTNKYSHLRDRHYRPAWVHISHLGLSLRREGSEEIAPDGCEPDKCK